MSNEIEDKVTTGAAIGCFGVAIVIQLGIPVEQVSKILQSEYDTIDSQRTRKKDEGGSKEQNDV